MQAIARRVKFLSSFSNSFLSFAPEQINSRASFPIAVTCVPLTTHLSLSIANHKKTHTMNDVNEGKA